MITIKQTNSYNLAQIIYETDEERFYVEQFREKLKYKNPGAKYARFASDYIYFCTPTFKFRKYLSEYVLEQLLNFTENVQIENKLLNDLHPINLKMTHHVPNEEFVLRDYQINSVKSLLKYGTGIITAATGAGKSLLITSVFNNLIRQNLVEENEVCVLLVPTCALVIQMYKDMLEYGMDKDVIQKFSSKSKEILKNQKIIISNRDWFKGHYEEFNKIYNIKCLFVDEVHTISGGGTGNATGKFIEKLQIPIKFGCTATLANMNCEQAKWYIQGIIGVIRENIGVLELQEREFLAKVNIMQIEIVHKKIPTFPRDTYEDICNQHRYEYQWLNENETILKIQAKFLDKLKGNTLMLFKNIQHGEDIFKYSKSNNKHLIAGKIDVETRDEIRGIAENTNDCKIIGNHQCVGTGINIKNIQNIVFVAGGKSLIATLQAIGRGLRLLKGKTHVNIYDITHNLKYSENHFKERKRIYKTIYEIKKLNKKQIFLK